MKEFNNYLPPTWDELFMGKVYEIASKSKDPRTKIGAVLVKNGYAPLEGFNGICRGVNDIPERMVRPEKYHWMEHAERNVINMAAKFGISTENGILYTQGMLCVDCARGVVNCGIVEIVLHKQWEDISTQISTVGRPWAEHYFRSKTMFDEAGITVRYLDCKLGKTGYLDGKSFNV
jgi:dCMP deaminase